MRRADAPKVLAERERAAIRSRVMVRACVLRVLAERERAAIRSAA